MSDKQTPLLQSDTVQWSSLMTGLSSYPQTIPVVPDLNFQACLLIQGLYVVGAFASAPGTRLCSYFVSGCFGIIQRFKDSFLIFKKNNK